MSTWTVGIVGGGPGGLMTAYTLQKLASCPVSLTVFEASPRLGGKILTPQFRTAPVRYEAGAAEFYDYSQFDDDPLTELVAELGLPVRPMGGAAVVVNHRVLSNLDDVRDQLGPQAHEALLEFDRLAKDRMTPREFYSSGDQDGGHAAPDHRRFDAILAAIGDPDARRYVETLIHSDLATEPGHTSVEYGLQNYLMNDPAYMRLYGIEGGNDRLPRALSERIEATTLLEHQVESVGRNDDARLRVQSVHRGEPRQHDFDFVVVALPHSHLGSVAYRGDDLAEAMRRHHAHYDHPAHYLRITALFDRPFWREMLNDPADSYWMLDAFGGCCLYDESSRDPDSTHGVLGWLLGGEAARRMSSLGDEQLVAEALGSLPEFLAHGRGRCLEGRVHRWVGAVNAMPGGVVARDLDQRHRPEPVRHPNLFVVGDYLFDSTLNGVLDSAEYAAAWLAALTTDNPKGIA